MNIPESILAEPAYAVLFGIFFVFFTATLLIIFLLYYQKRLLQARQKADQLEKVRQKELINAGVLAQEQDRKRMAQDLHDGLGGGLTAMKYFVGMLEPNQPEDQFDPIQQRASQTLEDNISELRRIISDLLPKSLEEGGLLPAIRGMIYKLESIKDINVHLHVEQERRIDTDKEKAVFRIIQELINNTIKHSEARNLNLHILFGESQLKIHYREDGPGFDPDILRKEGRPDSYGFKSMASRVAFLDGHFEAHTAPNEGFQVHLCIPIPSASHKKNEHVPNH